MLIKVATATLEGISAVPVTVEVNSSVGLRFSIVGLPDNAVKESHERIMSAFEVNGYQVPGRQIIINLAPADLKKEGSGFDLPMAIGILGAVEKIKADRLDRFMLVGELGLDGSIQPVKGALPIAILARKMGMEGLFVPKDNVREAAVVNNLNVFGVEHLKEVVDYFNNTGSLEPTVINTREEFFAHQYNFDFDFSEVKGQENVKRAFEIAAAGGHNLLLIGSPGCGKSMMSKRLPSILPPLSLAESLETTQIHSIAGKLSRETSLISQRPFRSPHHTVSDVALCGGGNTFMPGEICLAHNGVLFLDEFPEFSRSVLETLRQPLEDRVITISRARYNLTLPCSFMLVASMNPCPCGYHHHPTHPCTCTPGQIQRYLNRISGPLLDRIDIHIEATEVPFSSISKMEPGEPSEKIRERVIKARQIQEERFKDYKGIHCNAQMTERMIQQFAKLDAPSLEMLRRAMEHLHLSARAYERILKVARTIADLAGSENIERHHVAEAVGYRSLDRESWVE